MHGPPIIIETLGDLVAHGYGINARCSKCRHSSDLDMAALIGRLGNGFRYVGRRTLDSRLTCSRGGARRDVSSQIHCLDAGRRSRLAD
jgi:hypothetical protein